jgi:hypothetical protein
MAVTTPDLKELVMLLGEELAREVEAAIWAGDVERLSEIAYCRCCCHVHTFGRGCPAYAWGGCRGQDTVTREEMESWIAHYERFHGMTRDQFFGE